MSKLSKEEVETMKEMAFMLALELAIRSNGFIEPTDVYMVIVGAYVMGMEDALTQKNQISDEEVLNLFFPKR